MFPDVPRTRPVVIIWRANPTSCSRSSPSVVMSNSFVRCDLLYPIHLLIAARTSEEPPTASRHHAPARESRSDPAPSPAPGGSPSPRLPPDPPPPDGPLHPPG